MKPWQAIDSGDVERKQDFAEAVRTFECVVAACAEYGYRTIAVPTGPVADRVAFVADAIAEV